MLQKGRGLYRQRNCDVMNPKKGRKGLKRNEGERKEK